MSWLKTFIYKRFSKRVKPDFTLAKNGFLLVFRWNQTQKILVGVVASVVSMVILISFFESLEESSVDQSPSKAENLEPQLGASDDLFKEFGLDASLPIHEPEFQTTDVPNQDSTNAKAVIRTVSVEQKTGTDRNDGSVYHAVGLEIGQQRNQGRVQHITGESPVYVSKSGQQNHQIRTKDKQAAVWLTGEIEEVHDLPVDGSYRRYRNQR
ncbi:hypothetical protein [Gimesia aquarii]|uniref:Uncharacterized protein n=1 Tax=Gimesia aquarii TaxID=2527964 RepID=A0A517WTE6_9PLAN|nr:hypothetical protein [Gimesia aquarii]QDU08525.1 hypothetical protein V202x_18940 [Gimesia aquarii]